MLRGRSLIPDSRGRGTSLGLQPCRAETCVSVDHHARLPGPALITKRRLRARVRALGRRISSDYRGKDLLLIGVLKGSFIFLADLVREITIPLSRDFLRVSSYGADLKSSGRVRFRVPPDLRVRGRHVLLVDDIIDTGLTMSTLLASLRRKRPASLRVCALLHKPARARKRVSIDYLGFTIPNRFVVGYGLDAGGLYWNLPCIAALK